MTCLGRALLCCIAVLSFSVIASNAHAQTFQPLAAMEAPPREPAGRLLQIADGVFLGTSEFGGAFDKGTIYVLFRRGDGTWGAFVVHSFYGPEGMHPRAGLIRASDGNYYGTAPAGGSDASGTVYRMTPTGRVTLLHDFAGTITSGAGPHGPVVEAPDGSLWGTTEGGGPMNTGTIFRVTKTGVFATMHEFSGEDGSGALAGLVLGADGNFYGTTARGGTDLQFGGTAFRITPAGVLTTLHNFYDGPGQLIVGNDGAFYAVTENPSWPGRVFRVTTTGAVTILAALPDVGGDVAGLKGALVQTADGTLFGTALANRTPSPNQDGAVFRLPPGGSIERIATLGGVLGVWQQSGLTLGSDGFIYGASELSRFPTSENPSSGYGTVYRLPVSGPASLVALMSTGGPTRLLGRLVEAGDGRLYGVSCAGGTYNFGTVYRLEAANTVTVLHSFEDWDGLCPSGITLGPDGALYGTARGGTGNSWATVFRITTSGAFTKIWERGPGEFRIPTAPPTFGADGNMYFPITNLLGGESLVLRVTPAGASTDLGAPAGISAVGQLVLANDGNLYGTAGLGSNAVYRLNADDSFTIVRIVDDSTGYSIGTLQASDGKLYGAVSSGGSSGAGLLFSTTLDGSGATLHEFSFGDGANPLTQLLETGPGQFTGVTTGYAELAHGLLGTLFRFDVSGSLTTLHRFAWWDGALPYGGVTRAADGALYGTTYLGGWLGGGGVIYRVVQ